MKVRRAATKYSSCTAGVPARFFLASAGCQAADSAAASRLGEGKLPSRLPASCRRSIYKKAGADACGTREEM